ncbi:MAG: L-rhamnose mutarotase [Tateyamaria sp.]|uniref:L-rhamnose mutarotase n=2 Tax=Tateyamaria sp. TaxID=1929288 RepID=UPI00329D0B06
MVQRMGRVIGIKPEGIARYKELHAAPWPDIVKRLKERNIQNFSIFLREPENLLFSYWEYTGTDFEADSARNQEDPHTKEWWNLTAPLQDPLNSIEEGGWWASMEQVFYAE